jgi:hypothetical protein
VVAGESKRIAVTAQPTEFVLEEAPLFLFPARQNFVNLIVHFIARQPAIHSLCNGR